MTTYCERKLAPKSAFDPRSFRWKRSGRARVLVACPRGEWAPRKQRCRKGLRAYKVLVAGRGRCKRGEARVSKR